MRITEEKWSETGNRVDFSVAVSRLFKSSYQFKAHIVGTDLKNNDIEEMIEELVDMIDRNSYKRGKKGTYIFPMRGSFNATGYIYEKNFPSDEQE